MAQQQLLLPDETEVVTTIADARRDVRYVVVDYPVEMLVGKFKERPEEEGDIYVPEYQRTLAWIPGIQSYFIESLVLRVPVPPVFFYDVHGRLEIVDGSQRIRTLWRYLNNQFRLEGLEKLEILNGFFSQSFPTRSRKD